MTKKIISLTLIVMLMATTSAYALPNYTLPSLTLEKLEGMPDPNESLRSVYDSALKKLESKGFGKNSYPNGMGTLTAPTGFGQSASDLYKSKFGISWSKSPSTIASTSTTNPSTSLSGSTFDLSSIYNSFKSTLNTGGVNELKNDYANASNAFTLPSKEELDTYAEIDSKKAMEAIEDSFDQSQWQDAMTAEAKKDLADHTLLGKIEDIGGNVLKDMRLGGEEIRDTMDNLIKDGSKIKIEEIKKKKSK